VKRTKEWWARLDKDERSHLVYLERHQNEMSYGSSYLPDDVGECPACGQFSNYGLCKECWKSLEEYIAKGNGESEG